MRFPGHLSARNADCAVQNGLREVEVNWTKANLLASDPRAKGITAVMTKAWAGKYATNRRRAEIAVLSHREDVALLIHEDGRRRLARALAAGVVRCVAPGR